MAESHPLPIDSTAAHLSGVLQKFLTDIDSNHPNQIVFIICDVPKHIMKTVFQWMHHHRNDPLQKDKKLTGQLNMLTFHKSKKRTKMSKWDNEFFKTNHNSTCEIMKAAKALKVPGLYKMAAQFIADLLCKPVSAIKRDFHVPLAKKPNFRDPLGRLNHTLQHFRYITAQSRLSSR